MTPETNKLAAEGVDKQLGSPSNRLCCNLNIRIQPKTITKLQVFHFCFSIEII